MKLKGMYVMLPDVFENVYNEAIRQRIEDKVDIVAPVLSKEALLEDLSLLSEVDVIFTGWGAPLFDEDLLSKAPKLKVVFYAAGTIKDVVTPAFWEREIAITTANVANAIPVAEYTLGMILLSLKNVWKLQQQVKEDRHYSLGVFAAVIGNYQSTVGIISLSQIGRMVINHLKQFDVNVIAYDPYVSEVEAQELGVEKVSLEALFKRADVVSLHAPLLDDTREMVKAEHFESMKAHATFINTARGAIVDEPAMIDILSSRSDLTAILDVTSQEPPQPNSRLYKMDNVILTPHIAGSAGGEHARLGAYMVDELDRFLNHEGLKYQVSYEQFQRMA